MPRHNLHHLGSRSEPYVEGSVFTPFILEATEGQIQAGTAGNGGVGVQTPAVSLQSLQS